MRVLQGHIGPQKSAVCYTRRGYHLIVSDVPAWVCGQCGEPLFDEATVEALQAMLREMDARVEKPGVLP